MSYMYILQNITGYLLTETVHLKSSLKIQLLTFKAIKLSVSQS